MLYQQDQLRRTKALHSGAGIYAFEHDAAGGPGFKNYWDAVWWKAMLLPSLGSEYCPQTSEGRTLCLVVFAVRHLWLCSFGYITATLACFFVGRDAKEPDNPLADAAEVAELKGEIQALHAAVEKLAAGNEL